MTDFTGIKCPVCGKPFLPTDDIVVCPDCGAPYHRECYQKVGHCLYEDQHGTGKAWQPPQDQQNASGPDSLRCPRCGHDNTPGALFCEHCGAPLSAQPTNTQPYGNGQQSPTYGSPQQRQPYNNGQQNVPYGQQPPYGSNGQSPYGQTPPNGWPYGQMPFVFDPLAGIKPDEEIDGAKASELAKVVQSNTSYYLPVFYNASKYHKRRFNFAALLLGGGWLLYRKLYKVGSIITVIILALEVISQFITARFTNPLLTSMMSSLGISTASSMSMQQMYQIAGKVLELPFNQQLLFFLPEIFSIGIFVTHLVIGFMANKMYRKHCVKTVQSVLSVSLNESESTIHYQEKGGVNTMLLTLILICSLIVSNVVYFF
ncbi:MAG: zinc-ribbon domain-containing protein [Oscillospiraceae bacterium]|jgi:predicted amidophosphoribosyltransferase|nr:zinc-ribbon domain-containing protein [Oscillospiraceae bacterium]MDD3261812.1 RING finger protein [Oscillospiraceae bacterium]